MGVGCLGIGWRSWDLCACLLITMTLIPMGYMFPENYVPDPVGAYVIQGLCLQSRLCIRFSSTISPIYYGECVL